MHSSMGSEKTVETSRGYMSSLSLEQQTAFNERYRLVLEAGQVEEATPTVPSTTGKRGSKKQSRAKNLLDPCQRYQNEILKFMRDFTVPFTNNQAERDLRMTKVQQKISGTFRSEEGARDFCRGRGYIVTVKKHNQSILTALAGAVRGNPFRSNHCSFTKLNSYIFIF
jgi:transposase